MQTDRVPALDWPDNLFRDAADQDILEAQANPFIEAADFCAAPERGQQEGHVCCPEYALAA